MSHSFLKKLHLYGGGEYRIISADGAELKDCSGTRGIYSYIVVCFFGTQC